MFLDLCIVLVELVFRLVYCFSQVTLRECYFEEVVRIQTLKKWECYSEEIVRIVKGVLL